MHQEQRHWSSPATALSLALLALAGPAMLHGCSAGDGSPPPATAAAAGPGPDAAPTAQAPAPAPPPPLPTKIELSALPCAIDGPEIGSADVFETIGPVALTPDGSVYLLDNQAKTRRYRAEPGPDCVLQLVEGFGEGGILDTSTPAGLVLASVTADAAGRVVVGMQFESTRITGNTVDYRCDDSCGQLVLHPAGNLAVSPFGMNHRLQKVSFGESACTVQNVELTEDFETFAGVGFSGEQLYVGGYDTVDGEQGPHQIRPYGLDGTPTGPALGGSGDGEDVLCTVARVIQCQHGICVLDSGCRAIRIWNSDGTFRRAVDLEELLGVNQPRVIGVSDAHDGTAYATVAVRRARRDYVGRVYRITGL